MYMYTVLDLPPVHGTHALIVSLLALFCCINVTICFVNVSSACLTVLLAHVLTIVIAVFYLLLIDSL